MAGVALLQFVLAAILTHRLSLADIDIGTTTRNPEAEGIGNVTADGNRVMAVVDVPGAPGFSGNDLHMIPTDRSSLLASQAFSMIRIALLQNDVHLATFQVAEICRSFGLTHYDFAQACPQKLMKLVANNLDKQASLDETHSAVDTLITTCDDDDQCDLQQLEAALAYEHFLLRSPSYPEGQRINLKLPRISKTDTPPTDTPFIISKAFDPGEGSNSCDDVLKSLKEFETTRESHAEYYEKGLESFDKHIDAQKLLPIHDALDLLSQHQRRREKNQSAAYVHWYMIEEDWNNLNKSLFPHIEEIVKNFFPSEQTWANKCFPTNTPEDLGRRYEFFFNFRWWAIYAGNTGVGMFSHKDRHGSGSYQAQLCGAKRWRICDPNFPLSDDAMYSRAKVQLDGKARTSDLGNPRDDSIGADLFDIDYEQRILFRLARCYDDVSQPGDVLYYPANYWHQTMTMSTLDAINSDINSYSFSLSSLLADKKSVKNIKEALEWECQFAGKNILDGIPKLEICEIITSCVFDEWDRLFSNE